MEGTGQPVAFSALDLRDGPLRPSQAQTPLAGVIVQAFVERPTGQRNSGPLDCLRAGSGHVAEHDADVAALAGLGQLRRRAAIGGDFKKAHTAQDSENLSG